MTRHVDLSLFTGSGGEAEKVDALLDDYEGRIADARAFALKYRVLLIRTASGVEVDVGLAGLPFEAEMIARAADVEYEPDVVLRICSAEDLVVLKAFADRPQDRADLLGIARRRGRALELACLAERLRPLGEAKDAPEILDGIESLRREFER